MAKPIEEHLADFLVDQYNLGLKDYCRRTLEHWKLHYGEAMAMKAYKLAAARMRKG